MNPLFERNCWMSKLPDNVKLSKLAIPGTHDSATSRVKNSLSQTQTWSIKKQLDQGIRFLDIRGRHKSDRLAIHHGAIYQKISFGDVVNQCKKWLNANPNECIVMSLKKEHTSSGNTRSYAKTVQWYLDREDPSLWYTKKNVIPTLKSVRGKIIIINRFDSKSDIGYSWGSIKKQDEYKVPTTTAIHKGVLNIFDEDKWTVPDIDWKWKKFENFIKKPKADKSGGKYYVNFASGYAYGTEIIDIKGVAKGMNPKVEDHFRCQSPKQVNYGCMVPMDFPTQGAIDMIIYQSLMRYNLLPGRRCTIKNTTHKEYLYAANYKPLDKKRRQIWTYRPNDVVTQSYWRIIPAGGSGYYIWNEYQKEYLYASDHKPYDDDRRHVYTHRQRKAISTAKWKLVKSGSNHRVYNINQKEYLYAANNDFAYDKWRRRVFTWRPGDKVKQGVWKINYL